MKDLYFPGWSFCTKAKNFDRTARSRSLPGFEWRKLNNWNCCGAAFPLATDTLMAPLPSARILGNATGEGFPGGE
jgi:heterodisulfide reductase subunit B